MSEAKRSAHQSFDVADGLAVREGSVGADTMAEGVLSGDFLTAAAKRGIRCIDRGISDHSDVLSERTSSRTSRGGKIGLQGFHLLGPACQVETC
jgi:hypothetical protein